MAVNSPKPSAEDNENPVSSDKPAQTPLVGPKRSLAWVAVCLFGCIGVVLVVALGFLFVTGAQFTETQLHGFNMAAAVVTAVISYISLGQSQAVLEGSRWGLTIRIVGPLCGALSAFIVFSMATPRIAPRTAWVYLSLGNANGSAISAKIDGFTIRYRGQHGPLERWGQKGAVLVDSLSWQSDELAVDDIECVGYAPAKRHPGNIFPLNYPIVKGEVTIEMVKAEPLKDPMPDPEQILALIKAHKVSETKIREQGKYTKKEVSLRIENGSDRPIDFVCFDCIVALELKDSGDRRRVPETQADGADRESGGVSSEGVGRRRAGKR